MMCVKKGCMGLNISFTVGINACCGLYDEIQSGSDVLLLAQQIQFKTDLLDDLAYFINMASD